MNNMFLKPLVVPLKMFYILPMSYPGPVIKLNYPTIVWDPQGQNTTSTYSAESCLGNSINHTRLKLVTYKEERVTGRWGWRYSHDPHYT